MVTVETAALLYDAQNAIARAGGGARSA
jgi:hypothetical protein